MDWYPHEIDAYDADTLTLTLAEDGAYSRLLRWYYKHEKPLPTDPKALAAICRVTTEEWEKVAPIVLSYFVTRDRRVSNEDVSESNGNVPRLHNCKADRVLLKQNKNRRDAADRQRKLRDNNIIDHESSNDDVTRDSRVSHAARGEERRGDNPPVVPQGDFSQGKGFDQFWEAYPHKVGEAVALKAWTQIQDPPELEVILAAVKRYAADKPADRAWLNPAKWLREKRWTDQPADAPPPAVTGITPMPADLTGWRAAAWKAFGATVYRAWIAPCTFHADAGKGEFVGSCPSAFHARRLRDEYGDRILNLWNAHEGNRGFSLFRTTAAQKAQANG